MDWTLGVQHSFWNDYTVEVRYIGTRGIHLDVQSIVNLAAQTTPALHLPTYIGNVPSQAALDASTVNLGTILNSSDGIVPLYDAAGFNQNALTAFIPAGSSTYHGMALQVTRRMSHGLQFVGAYTYSHLIDNSTADFHTTDLTPRRQQDFENLSADRSNSALDHRHRFTLALVYDEPFFKSGNAFTRNVLGNWEIAPIYTYQTGEWATAQSGVDANLNGDSAGDRTITNPAGKGVTGSGGYAALYQRDSDRRLHGGEHLLYRKSSDRRLAFFVPGRREYCRQRRGLRRTQSQREIHPSLLRRSSQHRP